MTRRIKKSKVKDLRDLKKKSISPIISVVLLLVIAVILVGVMLSFGQDFTVKGTEKTSDILYKEDSSLIGFVYSSNPRPDGFTFKNLSSKPLEITHYEIIGSGDSEALNITLPLSSSIIISEGSQVSIPVICSPGSSYQVKLISSDGTFVTVPINNVNYQLNSCESYTKADLICLDLIANGIGDTNSDPIVICDVNDLNNVRNGLEKYYELGRDIDLNVSPYNEGEGWEPIINFSGNFNGNGHTISNLYINISNSKTGLFGNSYNAKILNLKIKDCDIVGGSPVGGIIGESIYSIIENSSVTGKINGNSDVGGFIGLSAGDTISNCYSNSVVSGSINVGGFIGFSMGTTGINNYSTSSVTGENNAGGFVGGIRDSLISNSYYAGEIFGENNAGGFFGNDGRNNNFFNCFWDVNLSNQTKTEDVGLTWQYTEALKTITTFNDWDFDDVWDIEENITYPYLRNNLQDPLPQ